MCPKRSKHLSNRVSGLMKLVLSKSLKIDSTESFRVRMKNKVVVSAPRQIRLVIQGSKLMPLQNPNSSRSDSQGHIIPRPPIHPDEEFTPEKSRCLLCPAWISLKNHLVNRWGCRTGCNNNQFYPNNFFQRGLSTFRRSRSDQVSSTIGSSRSANELLYLEFHS